MITFTSWDSELYHHGIRGQKWGIRRFQNPDGSLTAEGRARYLNKDGTLKDKYAKELYKTYKKAHTRVLGYSKRDAKNSNEVQDIVGEHLIFENAKTVKRLKALNRELGDFVNNRSNKASQEEKSKFARAMNEKARKIVEESVKELLGKYGKKLIYSDEPDTQFYKYAGEKTILRFMAETDDEVYGRYK